MKLNLLLISAEEIPDKVSQILDSFGYPCYFSRGRLKTKEILQKEEIKVILWFFFGKEHEIALAKDLLVTLNDFSKIPVILMTQNYEELEFAEEVIGLYANHDFNDDLNDIINTIESAGYNKKEINTELEVAAHPEIDFKNIVHQVISHKDDISDLTDKAKRKSIPNMATPWIAVDNQEKDILAKQYKPEKGISRVKKLFSKE